MTMTIRTTETPLPRGAGLAWDDVPRGLWPVNGRPVPVWLRRLHADSLPATETPSPAWRGPSSQRFVERWGRVANGY
jgi:hypothetical protein